MTTTAKPQDTARLMLLVAALDQHEKAKQVPDPTANPYAEKDFDTITADPGFPAVNMAAKAPDTPMAYDLEVGRHEARLAGRAKAEQRKKAQQRARAARKVEFDKIASSKTLPPQERLDRAWVIVFHMVSIITQIAKSKQRWANRMLGSSADDIPQMALEKMALVIAKQSIWDLATLQQAAMELGAASKKGKVPGDQMSDDERKERKQIRKARKWLMGMANNRVMGALVDSYTDQKNLRWDNLDVIATVMASINGPGEDPLTANFKASRAPAFLGTRFQRPDGIDANLLAMGITAAITERGLDPLVEFILDDEHRRVDGAVKWSAHAKEIFLLTPGGKGEWMWQAVEQSTANSDHKRKARGDAARMHVRNLFGFLPGVITSLVDSFDPQFRGWSPTDRRAVMASDFELFYCPDKPGTALQEARLIFEPALRYGTVEEAAQALADHLALLTTGEEVVGSVVNA